MERKWMSWSLTWLMITSVLSTGLLVVIPMEDESGEGSSLGPFSGPITLDTDTRGGDWNDTLNDKSKVAIDQGIDISNEGAEIPHLILFDDFVKGDGATPNPYLWTHYGLGTDASDHLDIQGQKLRMALSLSSGYESQILETVDPVHSDSYMVRANFTVHDATDEDANVTVIGSLGSSFGTVVIDNATSSAKVLTKQGNVYSVRSTSTAFFSEGTEYDYNITVMSTSLQVVVRQCDTLAVMWDSGPVNMDPLPFDNKIKFSCAGTSGTGNTTFDNITIENTLDMGWLRSEYIPINPGHNWDMLCIDKTELFGTMLTVTVYDANNDLPISGLQDIAIDGEADISTINPASTPVIYLNATFFGTGSQSPILHFWGVSWSLPGVWRDTFYMGGRVWDTGVARIHDGNVSLAPDPSSWTKYVGNPVLSPSLSFDADSLGKSCVIKEGSVFKMWYSGYESTGGVYRIGYATSSDGINWNKYGLPVLDVGPSGTWEDEQVSPCSIIHEDDLYKMWYRGYDGNVWRIGFASSLDGIIWIRSNENPILSPSISPWEDVWVHSPSVLNERGQYRVWYSGQSSTFAGSIGYASSLTTTNWVRYGSNPLMAPGPGAWESIAIGESAVVRNGDALEMWYSGTNGLASRIGHATSSDGVNWIKDTTFVIDIGPSTWDNGFVFSPTAVLDEGIFKMWYLGGQSTVPNYIGHALSSFSSPTTITSSAIAVPATSYAHTLEVDKTVPFGTYLNISVLNGSDDVIVPGYNNLTGTSIDLTSINPLTYPTLKLRAWVESSMTQTPVLHAWSLNFTADEKPMVEDLAVLSAQINRTGTITVYANISDKEEQEDQLDIEFKYRSPSDGSWKTAYFSNLRYETDRWAMDFTPPAQAILGSYKVNVTCADMFNEQGWDEFDDVIEVVNNVPLTIDVSVSADEVPRTGSVKVEANGSDAENMESALACTIEYKSVTGSWTPIIPGYATDRWRATFTPAANAELGLYSFRARMMDTDTDASDWVEIMDALSVVNNPPPMPDVYITPDEPYSPDDLYVEVDPVTDVEGDAVTLFYEWYRDDELQPDLDAPILDSGETAKGEVWTCMVYANDGIDDGPKGEATVTILNSYPEAVSPPSSLEMYEDTADWSSINLLDIFRDADEDTLTFSHSGEEHISVEFWAANGTVIFRPEANWFGEEEITFFANDSVEVDSFDLDVIVNEVNDVPVLEKMGEQSATTDVLAFTATEDEYLNLTTLSSDIDGDKLMFTCNLSDGGADDIATFYINPGTGEISFLPKNEDVGTIYGMVVVSDGRGGTDFQNITITVLNTNDAPQVTIDALSSTVFEENDTINLSITLEDDDLVHGAESFTYEWSSNITGALGTESPLTNLRLAPGYHEITVKVTDSGGLTASDSVSIVVNPGEEPDDFTDDTTDEDKGEGGSDIWLYLIIVIVIVVVVIMLLVVTKKKKKEEVPMPAPPTPMEGDVEATLPESTTQQQMGAGTAQQVQPPGAAPPTEAPPAPTAAQPPSTETQTPGLPTALPTSDPTSPPGGATAAQQPLPPDTAGSEDADPLQKLMEQKEQGLLTQEEFNRKKQELLNEL